ncbi:hypothetical protein A7985_06150 [Pseudoalteromonas luteoviolacea]|uniref:YdhG-like domain-containing protein n=1 Tax=Pseudoalteromonas luteoviolacea TaxID=43657 RepID=A0A1C0TW40_9GAMM|nr:hypothetical protein [Pseudoalteromonas luteoviolacea]OCQ23519.1 hypothetical protein A7985_06150 [Pseudoalteromonas luteoviolacea]
MNRLIKQKFAEYPDHVREKLGELHALIIDVAGNLELGPVDESLKWGEASYSVKSGSPIRIDWKRSSPTQYFIFFNCQTKLVDTFRVVYGKRLVFQKNRAIILSISEPIPNVVLSHCIELAFTYKQRRGLPLLGVERPRVATKPNLQ